MEKRRNELSRGEREPASKRFERIGSVLALSAAIHGGALFHREIGTMMQEVPRNMRAFANSYEAGKAAEKMLDSFREQLEAGEPLDLDLSEFHFQDELLRGGVSQAEVERAKEKYRSIIGEAKQLQDAGKSKDEVLGYVLKMQGEYRPQNALMTDLLDKGYGNCEARAKYISATVQDLYPEYAEEGKLQLQNFGEWRDASGKLHDGHIRVVIDEGGETVSILEGDAVFQEVKDPENPIPQFEVTNVVAKASLAKAEVFSYREGGDGAVLDTGIQKTTVEKAKQWTSGNNSTLAFPRSAAKYGDVRGTADIRPVKVADSWARSNFEWKPDMELVELEKAFTMEEAEGADPRAIDLTNFDTIDEIAWNKLGERIAETRKEGDVTWLTARAGIPLDFSRWPEDAKKEIAITFIGNTTGNELHGFKPYSLEIIMPPDSSITNFAGADITDTPIAFSVSRNSDKSLSNIMDKTEVIINLPKNTGRKARNIRFRGREGNHFQLPTELGNYTDHLVIQQSDFSIIGSEPLKVNTISLVDYSVQSANSIDGSMASSWVMNLKDVDAQIYDLVFSQKTLDSSFFHDEVTGEPYPVYENKVIAITQALIAPDTFRGMNLHGLSLKGIFNGFRIEVLRGTKIQELELLGQWDLFYLPFILESSSSIQSKLEEVVIYEDTLKATGDSWTLRDPSGMRRTYTLAEVANLGEKNSIHLTVRLKDGNSLSLQEYLDSKK